MSIGPRGPLLKNDGPTCRCCGCTEHNACTEMGDCAREETRGKKIVMVGYRGPVGCHWVKVEGATEPLCSACSGTGADLAEAISRMLRYQRQHGVASFNLIVTTGMAAQRRYRARLKLSA